MKKRKIRKMFVGIMTFIFGITAIISGAMLDSESLIPSFVFFMAMIWIALFCINNKDL